MRLITYACMMILVMASMVFANGLSTGGTPEEIITHIRELKAQGLYDESEWSGILSQLETELNPGGSLDQGADQCPATVIGGLPYNDTGTTVGRAADVAGCAGTSPDVIYQYTSGSGGGVHVSLCGSSYDTQLIVRTGGACPGDVEVACDDDSPCGLQSALDFCASPGQTYYIVVSGFSNASGDYALEVTANDDFCTFGRCCYALNSECEVTSNLTCGNLGGFFTEGATCDTPCPPPPPPCVCGPMDLVFAVDTTGSMGGAIASVVTALPAIIANANYFSCDLQLGLATFGDQVVVNHQLTANQAAVQASIAALTAAGGDDFAESSDEALLEIITGGSSCAVNNWTSVFRPAASKIIVLITDAPPGGCDDIYADGVDNVQAHNVALAAQAAGIRIASVFVPTNGVDPMIAGIMQDYAATTSGSYWLTSANGQGTAAAINEIVADCGQGILQIFAPVPELECIDDVIVPNPVSFDVTVANSGNEDCRLMTLTIGTGTGSGGTGTAQPDTAAIDFLGAGHSVDIPVTFTLVPTAPGFICFHAEVTSEGDCPPAFFDICFEIPRCLCEVPNPVVVDLSGGIPHCECIEACAGEPLFLCFAPLSEDQQPSEVRFDEGCTGDPFREGIAIPGYGCENIECPPAYPVPSGDWNYDPTVGGWCTVVTAREDGCFCVCLDDILPVELNEFTAIASDEAIMLNWSTASEIDNDRFDIIRDGTVVGQVIANNSATGSNYVWTERNLQNGREYTYTLIAVSLTGTREEMATVTATPVFNSAAVTEYALHQNYPNPFNPETSISFDLTESGNVSLTVYNPLGQTVATLVSGSMEAGRHSVAFRAADLPSGLYFYQLDAGGFHAIRKMILMK